MSDENPASQTTGERFAVQYYADLFDYPEWWEDRDGVRFDTRDEAEAFIDSIIEDDYQRQVAEYEKQKPKRDRATDLHRRRREALQAAGLWKQEHESFSPLIIHGVPCHEPKRLDRSKYRVVTERELSDDD